MIRRIRTLAILALYALLGMYSGHLATCGAEFNGHSDGELAQLRTDAPSDTLSVLATPADETAAGAAFGNVPSAAGLAPLIPTSFGVGFAAVVLAALALVLSFGWRPTPRPYSIGQPVGRWYRTVVLLI